jgi:hypothetical protein
MDTTPPDGQITLEGPEGSSVIVEVRRQPVGLPLATTVSGPTTSRKGGGGGRKAQGASSSSSGGGGGGVRIGTTKVIDLSSLQLDPTAMSAAGALVSLAINPENPNEVVTLEQGTQIIDQDGTTTTYEIPQRATILQLTPSQAAAVLPQGNGGGGGTSGTFQADNSTYYYYFGSHIG